MLAPVLLLLGGENRVASSSRWPPASWIDGNISGILQLSLGDGSSSEHHPPKSLTSLEDYKSELEVVTYANNLSTGEAESAGSWV
jgi:hypothetical protein